MTDTNQYKRLSKYLNRTRKTLWEACRELDIDTDYVDDNVLEQHIQECTHCGIWGTNHILDLDDFPICKVCETVAGR